MPDELKNLATFGLSEREIEIYLSLIENGQTTAKVLTDQTKYKRPTVYLTLETLHQKGLVSVIEEGKIKLFEAQDPEQLREYFADKIQILNKELPRLKWLSNRISKKPSVRYFSGTEGARSAYLETLGNPKTTIRSIGSIEEAPRALGQNFAKNYIRNRKKKRIKMRSILERSEFAKELAKNNKRDLRECVFVNKGLLPRGTELNIFDHNVSFASYGAEPLGIIIENKEFAEILKVIFDRAYKKK